MFELSADWSVPLDRTYPTLAERLREAGYLTAGFSANVWYAGRESGFARGFIRFHDYPLTLGQIVTAQKGLNVGHVCVSLPGQTGAGSRNRRRWRECSALASGWGER